MGKDAVIRFSFSEPMVAEAEVGKPVKPEQRPIIAPALDCEVVWDSTSSMALKLRQGAARRTVYELTLPEGLVSVNGTTMPGGCYRTAVADYIWMDSAHDYSKPDSPIFFAAGSPRNDELVASAVGGAYARLLHGGEFVEDWPVKLRSATVGDALAHWSLYETLTDSTVDAKDRRAFAAMPPETPLPHVWLADGFVLDSPDERVVLMLPGLGRFERSEGEFRDLELESCSLPDYDVTLEAEYSAQGQYRLLLKPTQPFAETDAARAFEGTRWYVFGLDGKELEDPVELLWSEGAWKASAEAVEQHPALADMSLVPDLEATAASMQQRPTRAGEARSGLGQLVLRAHVGNHLAELRCVPTLSSLYGEEANPRWAGDAGRYRAYMIEAGLHPERPQLGCTVTASGLPRLGKRAILYRSCHVSKVTARVFRVEASGAAPARLLRAYAKQYTPLRLREADWSVRDKLADGPPTIFNTEGLPVEVVERELPLSEEQAAFEPASLFPDAPSGGVYFVELVGTPKAAEWGERRVVVQGLVQMTDLGLMWKKSERGLFAYAYRLSDATTLPEGSLHVLDAEGRELASLPVAQGIARGALPTGAAFLQLRAGDDAYTTRIEQDDDCLEADYSGYYFDELGINPAEFPVTSLFMFSDRSVYRPGETLHVKGIIRSIKGDEIVVPRVKSLTINMNAGGIIREIPVEVEADGSFSFSQSLEGCTPDNNAHLRPIICFEGDEDETAPDYALLKAKAVDMSNYCARSMLEENRKPTWFEFCVADFRRNEFELAGAMRSEGERVSMDVTATAFTGVPVSHGRVRWVLESRRSAFRPEKYADFRFGDSRGIRGYGDDDSSERRTQHRSATLDAGGRGSVEFELEPEAFPGRSVISVTAAVTNGNEQTLRCTESMTIDSSAVYAGLRVQGRLSESPETIPVDAVVVQADESDYTGEPLRCEVTATRRVFRSYRYGAEAMTAVRNVPEEEQVYRSELMVGGREARVEIPAKGPGIYDIVLRGQDASGKPFAAACRKYVWGGSNISPWEYGNGDEISLVADRDAYKVGDTARILVPTPVDAELLVTMERGEVRREFRRSVTVEKPVIEIPLEAGDGPVSYVSVFLVQKEQGRAATGLPLIKCGSVKLRVDVPEKRLALALQLPDTPPLAGQEWTVSGTVTGADGKPVPDAGVAVYAVDEGTLQVAGYELPDPHGHFYGDRPRGVTTYTTQGQLVGDNFDDADFGNKGVFIGGGDGGVARDVSDAVPRLRENFAPCALWLGNARTDAEGRFTATYAQPDTMTRYRLMAVAAADDRFGAAETSYSVVQPVMLEPSVPASAAAGDSLELPVTLSMLPESLPGGQRDEVRWTITLTGENVELGETTRSLTLRGKEPTTITIPVTLNQVGEARLSWKVQAEDPALAAATDAVALRFEVVPPTPYVRERFFATLKSGSTAEPINWFKAKLRPDARLTATLSTSPLVGAAAGCDFLFRYPYGCLEQTASTLLPWLFMPQLEKGLDIQFPAGRERGKVLAEGIRSLLARRRDDGHFAYWDRGDAASEFSAYALLVLGYADRDMLNSTQYYQMRQSFHALETELRQSADAPLSGLLTLALTGNLNTRSFDAIMQLHERPQADEAWVVAAAARCIAHPQADAYLAAARRGKSTERCRYMMPPDDACRLLEMMMRAPQKDDTARAVRDYVMRGVEKGRFLSTWEAGWLCIVMHEYLERRDAGAASRPRHVNGVEVTDGNPLRIDSLLGDTQKLQIRNGTLYVGGVAEGHERDAQPNSIVDRGFRVERRYEKLMPDGSWQPTAEFTVGDVVRVTLSAEGKLGSYMLVEDRLPAAFEAINPALPSQSLPPGVAARANECWRVPGWIDHTEYELDRVRFFASSWFGSEPLTVSYVARVVRSGQVTAPAAKAEFMYRPQVYGLSVPQSFTVKPRP